MKHLGKIVIIRSQLVLCGLIIAAVFAVTAEPAVAQASVTKSSLTIPLVNTPGTFNNCNGDFITWTSGNEVLRLTMMVNGNKTLIAAIVNLQGAKGTGSPSGLSYVVTGGDQFTMSASTSAFPVEMTFTLHGNVNAPGTSDFKTSLTTHMTINANGTVTANVINSGSVCAP